MGAGDSQVLVRLSDGHVLSIDRGDCFGSTATMADPVPIVTAIPGIQPSVGQDEQHVISAVEQIEAIDSKQLPS
jgi:hypothetical protein